MLRSAQLEVIACGFGGHTHLRGVEIRLGGLCQRRLRFVVAAQAAEKIQLPDRIERSLVVVLIARDLGEGLLTLTCARLDMAAACSHRRREIEARFTVNGTCLAQSCERDADIVVRAKRVLDEFIERRIVECFPEVLLELCRTRLCRFDAHELVGGRHLRLVIIGTDSARREDRGTQCECCSPRSARVRHPPRGMCVDLICMRVRVAKLCVGRVDVAYHVRPLFGR